MKDKKVVDVTNLSSTARSFETSKVMLGQDLGRKLIKILDLPKNAISIELKIELDEPVEVKCKYFAETDTEQLTVLLQEYTLQKK